MKVAFFIGRLSRGGMETLVLDTFRRRDVAPFECMLIYRNDGDLSDDYRATCVPMFRLSPNGSLVRYIYGIRRLLKREKVDILHTQTVANGLIGALCTCFSKVRLVASFHGLFSIFKYKVYTHLLMWIADKSVFVSDYERKWYENHILLAPKKRFRVVYNGIDFSKFDIEYEAPAFLKNTPPMSQGIIRMGMVGNFVRGRSQIFLCRVLKELKDRGTCSFFFYFIGKRSLEESERFDNCLQYCRENGLLDSSVFFLGGRGDVPSILSNIDAFVYSTESDSFGIAVVEAMAAGIPVLVNDWEVMKEISDNGALATLFKTLDVGDCADKIEDLVNNLAERKAMAKIVAEIIRERYSIEKHIWSLNAVYESAIGDN